MKSTLAIFACQVTPPPPKPCFLKLYRKFSFLPDYSVLHKGAQCRVVSCNVECSVTLCAVERKGCQVGSLLLLCHYSSFLSTFPTLCNASDSIFEMYFPPRCRNVGLCEVKPFPDFTSLQSRLPMQRKIYSLSRAGDSAAAQKFTTKCSASTLFS